MLPEHTKHNSNFQKTIKIGQKRPNQAFDRNTQGITDTTFVDTNLTHAKRGRAKDNGCFNQLGGFYVNGKPLNIESRIKIIHFSNIGMRACDISKYMRVSHGCVSKIITKFRETGSISPGFIGGSKPKVATPEVVDKVAEYRNNFPGIFGWEIRNKLKDDKICKEDNLPSISSINRIVRSIEHNNNISPVINESAPTSNINLMPNSLIESNLCYNNNENNNNSNNNNNNNNNNNQSSTNTFYYPSKQFDANFSHLYQIGLEPNTFYEASNKSENHKLKSCKYYPSNPPVVDQIEHIDLTNQFALDYNSLNPAYDKLSWPTPSIHDSGIYSDYTDSSNFPYMNHSNSLAYHTYPTDSAYKQPISELPQVTLEPSPYSTLLQSKQSLRKSKHQRKRPRDNVASPDKTIETKRIRNSISPLKNCSNTDTSWFNTNSSPSNCTTSDYITSSCYSQPPPSYEVVVASKSLPLSSSQPFLSCFKSDSNLTNSFKSSQALAIYDDVISQPILNTSQSVSPIQSTYNTQLSHNPYNSLVHGTSISPSPIDYPECVPVYTNPSPVKPSQQSLDESNHSMYFPSPPATQRMATLSNTPVSPIQYCNDNISCNTSLSIPATNNNSTMLYESQHYPASQTFTNINNLMYDNIVPVSSHSSQRSNSPSNSKTYSAYTDLTPTPVSSQLTNTASLYSSQLDAVYSQYNSQYSRQTSNNHTYTVYNTDITNCTTPNNIIRNHSPLMTSTPIANTCELPSLTPATSTTTSCYSHNTHQNSMLNSFNSHTNAKSFDNKDNNVSKDTLYSSNLTTNVDINSLYCEPYTCPNTTQPCFQELESIFSDIQQTAEGLKSNKDF